ncbi:MAG: hypothetical protein ACOCWL_01555 [Thermoguttaceae bacterium]
MAQATDNAAPQENVQAAAAAGTSSSRSVPPWWRTLLEPKWIGLFVVLAVVVPGAVFAIVHFSGEKGPGAAPPGEVSIGQFRFLASEHERSPVLAATFSLHLALIPEAEGVARVRLDTHKFRVQQAVEQLLRQAHGGDFEDPSLGDLRRQLQAQVNETLGVRAVADCIVTDLDLVLSPRESAPPSEGGLAGPTPWSD